MGKKAYKERRMKKEKNKKKRDREKKREIRACNRSISPPRKGGPAESVS